MYTHIYKGHILVCGMMNLRHCDKLLKQVAKVFVNDRVVGGVFECVDCGKKFKILESWE